MSLLKFADKELDLLLKEGEEGQENLNNEIFKIIDILDTKSEYQREYILTVVDRLLSGLPLTPLTGEDDEWEERETLEVNKRCSQIVRAEGKTVDLGAVLISFDGGLSWENPEEYLPEVTFPYTPTTEPQRFFAEKKEDGAIQILGNGDVEKILEIREKSLEELEKKKEEFKDGI